MVRSLLVAALLASPALVLADPPAGQIDPTFGSFDLGIAGLQVEGFDIGGSLYDQAYALAQDAQGHLLLAGAAGTDDGYCLGLMRFTPDGQLDTSSFGFNVNQVAQGKICHPMPGAYQGFGFDIAMLPDGGFLVAGTSSDFHPYVCRFHADGRRMDSFNGTGCVVLSQIDNSGSLLYAPALVVRDASIFFVTNHVSAQTFSPVLARLSLDSGAIEFFGEDAVVPLLAGSASAFALDAVLTTDGDLMAVGAVLADPGDTDGFVARFDLQQFQPDTGFNGDGVTRFKFNNVPLGLDFFTAITLLSDGNVLAAGTIEMLDRDGLVVVQLDAATGASSPAFNDGAARTYDPCVALPGGCSLFVNGVAQSADHIVISGQADYAMFAARLTAAGSVDAGFGQQGLAKIESGGGFGATSMVMQDERIVLASTAHNGNDDDFALLRLSDGRLFSDQFEAGAL